MGDDNDDSGAYRRSGGGGRLGRQTRFQEVCNRVTNLAQELGPNAKLPTVVQLCERFAVSIATLNAVLSELEDQRIIRRRHGVGIYVAPNIRQARICVILDPGFVQADGSAAFWSRCIEQVRARGEADGESFSLHLASRSGDVDGPLPAGLAEELRGGRVDGVIGIGLPPPTTQWIEGMGVRFVAFAGPGKHPVGIDTEDGIRQGVTQLAALECQRIAFFASVAPYRHHPPPPKESVAVRVFQETLRDAELRFDPDLVWDNQYLIPAQGGIHTLSPAEQGYQAALELFGPHTEPDEWPEAIYSTDDLLTQGVLAALQRVGARVGEQVQIATHQAAGTPALLGYEERLIRLQYDPAELARVGFDALERLLGGERVRPETLRIKPRLIMPGEL